MSFMITSIQSPILLGWVICILQEAIFTRICFNGDNRKIFMSKNNQNHPRVLIHTLGCKVNQYDSEKLRDSLIRGGYVSSQAEDKQPPDLIIINTCSVTAESDRKCRQAIRKLIRSYPNAKIAVTGCYAQRKGNDIAQIPGVHDVVAIVDQEAWADSMVSELDWSCKESDDLWNKSAGIEIFAEHTRAFVKIQDGCDLKCTFCSIPDSRGKARSREISEVLEECRGLVRRGYPEIVLCGICLGHYGRDQNFNLTELLRKLLLIEDLLRIRISSLEPQDVSDELLELMAEKQEILCPHLHLPLQSGADAVLKRMRRLYSFDYFLDRIQSARQQIPNFEVTTDLMVGFPGETDAEFAQTLEAVRKCRFTKVHVFRFSARDGTPAARIKAQLPSQVIEERRKILESTAATAASEQKQIYINKILPVLSESDEAEHGIGFTPNYLKVEFHSSQSIHRGQVIPVRFTSIHKGRLQGEAVPDEMPGFRD